MTTNTTYEEDILSASRCDSLPWERLDGANILVTGATGIIGSCLVAVLMSRRGRGYQVFAMGRNERKASRLFAKHLGDGDFHLVAHDVLKPLDSHLRFDFIVDAASGASPGVFASDPVGVLKTNVMGLANLMDHGLAHGMKRLLYVSSGEVYGEGDGSAFVETSSGYVDPMRARSCYPSAKRAAETLCAAYADQYGADVVVARPAHVFGPNFTEQDNRATAQFLRNAARGENIVLKSSGEQVRSWIYVVDCVTALLHVLLKGQSANAYNVADPGATLSIREMAQAIAGAAGRAVEFAAAEAAESKGYTPVTRSLFDVGKLLRLGWTPMGSVKDNIAKTLKAIKI